MDKQQLLRDPQIEPTNEIIAEGLQGSNSAYIKFIDGLISHNIQVEWRYYNDGKAWLGKAVYQWTNTRGTQKELTVFWLSIWEGFFKVSIFVPEKARTEALNLTIGEKTKEFIAESKQMGKLKFFPLVFELSSDELFDDIYTLIDFKKTIK